MSVTFQSPPLVLGASGRIGQLLRQRWGYASAIWQARRPQPGEGWRLFDPLMDPWRVPMSGAVGQGGQILCLAGAIPGRGADLSVNAQLACAAVRAGAQAGCRVVVISSAAVYGAQAGPLEEARPLAPANAYGQAKADMEEQATALATELGVSLSIWRIGNVAGFDAALGGWRPGFALDRFPDGRTPRRSYIGPMTLADVMAALLGAPDLPDVLNIAQPVPVEMGALLQAAGREYVTAPAPDHAIAEVVLDVSRLVGFLAPALVVPLADAAEMIAEMALLEPDILEK